MRHVFLVGKNDPKKFSHFIDECLTEFSFKTIQFISDEIPKNEAGVLFKYRQQLLEDDPSYLMVMRYKMCSSFPLKEIIEYHKQREKSVGCGPSNDFEGSFENNNSRALLTVMTARLDQIIGQHHFQQSLNGEKSSSRSFGMFAIDESTQEILHYTEENVSADTMMKDN